MSSLRQQLEELVPEENVTAVIDVVARWLVDQAGMPVLSRTQLPCEHKLMSIKDAAALLGVPEGTLRKKVTAGTVPNRRVFKHTRFTLDDLRAIQQYEPGTVRRRP